MKSKVIGIDLGTTHSLVSVMQDGTPTVFSNELGQELTPSIVAEGKDGVMLVGQPAKERLLADSSAGIACFKRDMGTSKKYTIGSKAWNPIECSALILREMKRLAELRMGETVSSAVISVPAYFRDAQRQATIEAAELAGLKVERIINEPTAAALAFGYRNAERESNILVFDLGGGTFDVTMLEVFDGVVEVKSSAGESHLGGEDYTDLLLQHLVKKHALVLPPEEHAKWRERADKAKCGLAKADSVNCLLGEQEVEVGRDDLALAAKELNIRVRGIVRKCVFDAGLSAEQVDDVLLVGGASRMNVVAEIVESIVSGRINTEIDPDRAIALGAGVQAALIEQNEAVEDIVLTDVSPHTMGVEVAKERNGRQESGYFSPIIDRNTTLPVSRSDIFSTFHPQQDEVELVVYQGESRMTKQNHKVGVLKVKGLRNPKTGDPEAGAFEVRFTYDMNGILEVDVTILSSKKTFSQVFEQRPGSLSKKELNEALQKIKPLKIHPREKLPNRNRIERANRLFENLSGNDRDSLTQLIDHFEFVLSQQQNEAINEVAGHLDDFLNHYEEKF